MPDSAYDFGEGVIRLGTPGHGGLFLNPDANARIDAHWRSADGFYEEDEQWSIVAHHFPHLFTTRERKLARRTAIDSFPDEFMKVTGETIPTDFSRTLRERAFWAANAKNWVVRAASPYDRQTVKVVSALGERRRQARAPERWFLVPAAEYKTGPLPFVIDLNRHTEILDDKKRTFHPMTA